MRRLRPAPLLALLVLLAAACGPDAPAGGLDAGADAGADAGTDGGVDAGTDGGADAGTDGGETPSLDAVGIATFNVEMLFDTVCDSGECGYGDFEQVPTQAELDARARELAQGVRALDADVVLLQEVENADALDALHGELSDRYPVALVGEQGWPASMDVALLSSLPVLAVVHHQDERLPLAGGGTTTFTRDLLEVHLDAGDRGPVIVFVAHFKAKANDDPDRRLAEAEGAARIVAEAAAADPGALLVLGGDLNDVPGSPPLDALVTGGGLLRVASELVPDDGTYLYRGTWEAIDHLLLQPGQGGDYAAGSAEVVCSAGVAGLAGSDHCALRAEFDLR